MNRRLLARVTTVAIIGALLGGLAPPADAQTPPGSCAAWSEGPIERASPYYADGLDPDGNGVACEANTGHRSTAFQPGPGFEPPEHPISDIDYTPSGNGYWILSEDGTVTGRGDASVENDSLGRARDERFIGLAPTGSGAGYWVVSDKGRVVPVGDAPRIDDLPTLLGGRPLDGDIVGAAPTSTGRGFWMVGADGGVFALGDAPYKGSVPELQRAGGPLFGRSLAAPIVGLAPAADDQGYWMVAADGGMFAFGRAGFFGSIPGVLKPNQSLDVPIIGMIPQGAGYLILALDGGTFSFGVSRFHGSLGGQGYRDVVATAVRPDRSGYLILRRDGSAYPFGSSEVLGEIEAEVSVVQAGFSVFDVAENTTWGTIGVIVRNDGAAAEGMVRIEVDLVDPAGNSLARRVGFIRAVPPGRESVLHLDVFTNLNGLNPVDIEVIVDTSGTALDSLARSIDIVVDEWGVRPDGSFFDISGTVTNRSGGAVGIADAHCVLFNRGEVVGGAAAFIGAMDAGRSIDFEMSELFGDSFPVDDVQCSAGAT